MTQKGKPTKFYILFFFAMFAVIYLVKYAANSRDLTAEHVVDGFLQTLFLLITFTYHYYLSDRRSTLPKDEFKAILKKSMLIIFFSVWIVTSGASIIEKILLHAEVNWVKLTAFGFGCAVVSILLVIVMTKIFPVKIIPQTSASSRTGSKGA